jgi:hypothetical protein
MLNSRMTGLYLETEMGSEVSMFRHCGWRPVFRTLEMP